MSPKSSIGAVNNVYTQVCVYTLRTMHRTRMYVHKIFKKTTHHIRPGKGGEGRGSRGERGFRGKKRDQRKGDAKIISEFLHDSELYSLQIPKIQNNKISHPGTGLPECITKDFHSKLHF